MAQTGAIRAGRAFVELATNDAKLMAGLKRAQRMLAGFGARVAGLGAVTAAAGASMATPFLLASKVFQQTGDDLAKMALRTGVSVEALSELAYAAGQSGADIDTLEKSVKKMQQTIIDGERGTSTAIDAFDQLGLSVSDLLALNPEQQFLAIGDALSSIADPTRKAAVAAAVFGRAGTQLLPLLQDGAAGVAALREEARRLGLTVSTEAAKRAEVLGDRIDDVRRVVKAAAFEVGDALAPALTAVAKAATTAAAVATRFVKSHKAVAVVAAKAAAAIFAVGAAVTAAGLAIVGTGLVVGSLVATLSLASSVFAAVAAAAAAIATPIGLAVTGIAALGGAVLYQSGVMTKALRTVEAELIGLVARFKPVTESIAKSLGRGDIAAAAGVLGAELELEWESMAVRTELIWSGMLDRIGSEVKEWSDGVRAAAQLASDAMRDFDAPVRTAVQTGIAGAFGLVEQVKAAGRAAMTAALRVGEALEDGTSGLGEDLFDIGVQGAKEVGKIGRGTDRLQGVIADAIANAKTEDEREGFRKFLADVKAGNADLAAASAARGNAAIGAALRLLEAEQRLQDAIAAADSPSGTAGTTGDRLGELVRGLESAQTRLTSRGTFSADAIRDFGASAEKQALDAAEETAVNTKKIADLIRRGALDQPYFT